MTGRLFEFGTAILYLSIAAFLVIYFPRIKCWFAPLKKQNRIYSQKKNKLALIIPARNESMAISPLLESIKAQTYHKDNFDFFVLVKDENDKTIEMTENADGTIHVIADQTCKGDALDSSMQRILKETPDKYDAFIIVDADCVLDSMFLEEMNNALASGKQVIGTKKLVKNYYMNNKKANSIFSECNGLIWSMIDDLGNRYKSDNDITIMTIGTGLMIRSDFIKQLGGWPYRETLTEDIELMYDCMDKEIGTFYYSYALLYVEEATSLSVTDKRRTRWLTGVVDSKRIYNSRIKRKKNTRAGAVNYYYTTALTKVFYFIGFLTFLCFTNAILGLFLALQSNLYCLDAFSLAAKSFITIYLSFFVLSLACIIVDWSNIKISLFKKIIVLFVHPLFYMGYIPIIGRALLGASNQSWEIIDRVDFTANEEDFDDQTASVGTNSDM